MPSTTKPPITTACPSCGGTLYYFENQQPRVGVEPTSLPAACSSCKSIFLNGERLALPEGFEKKAVNLAIEADKTAKIVTEQMKADPELRVERYIATTYKNAYMQGFFRAMAYYQHLAKDGRLQRLARLWRQVHRHGPSMKPGGMEAMVTMDLPVYHEFDLLLQVRTKETDHGQGSADVEQPGNANEASVQGPPGSEDRGRGPVE